MISGLRARTGLAPPAVPVPRRARPLIPADVPRRRQLIAATAVVLVLAHLLLAPLTLVLTVAFTLTSRLSRWRLSWLLIPAAAGLAWLLADGLGPALAGFTAGPAGLLRQLAGPAARTGSSGGLLTGVARGLPRQLPAALPLAAAEAALLGWLSWLRTDEWAVPQPRPGLVARLRTAVTVRAVRSGAVLTRDGCALGAVPATGALAALDWTELACGVLVAGAGEQDVALPCLQVVHGALRCRKPVIVLGAGPDGIAARALAAACAATDTPLLTAAAGWPAADLEQVIAERTAVLLPADGDGPAIACACLAGLAAELRRIGVDGDALVWIPQAELVPTGARAGLLRDGASAGLSVLAGTTSPPAALSLAGQAGAVLIRRVADPGLAGALAERTGTRLLPPDLAGLLDALPGPGLPGPGLPRPGLPGPEADGLAASGPGRSALAGLVRCPAVPASDLLALGPAEFVLAVRAPAPRLVEHGRLVPARLPGPRRLS